MFSVKKQDNSCEQAVEDVYGVLFMQALEPVFFSDYGIEDTFEGRFDCLLLHVFMAMHVSLSHADGEAFNQTLFDVLFRDMDQALREIGKGDMGLPKQMRRMMKAFNGRMNRYHDAMNADDVQNALKSAIQDNVFGEQANVDDKALDGLSLYMMDNISAMIKVGALSLIAGHIELKPIKKVS